eukprot:UN02762
MSANLIDEKIDGDSNINANNGAKNSKSNTLSSISEFAHKLISPKFLAIVGIVASSVLIIEGFVCFTVCLVNVRSYILSFYYIVLGLLTIAAEMKFEFVAQKVKIIFTSIGRGFWYFFLGTLAFGGEWFAILTAVILLLLGVLNIVAGFYNKTQQQQQPLNNQDGNNENQAIQLQRIQLAQTAKTKSQKDPNTPNSLPMSNPSAPEMHMMIIDLKTVLFI